nr:sushi, von Willebrand factor type A, EGF and pentraxin domain-containing protein 1-like [Lytechinus pictus]
MDENNGISCEVLSEPTSIAISPETCLSDPRFGDICTLECEQSGFKITPPNLRELTCNSDQTWSGNTEEVQCVDLQAPEFEDCPQDMVVFVNRGEDSAYVEWSLVVRDNDPQSLELVGVCNQQPGIMTIGEYIISCSAVDEEGNEGLCRFTLEVKARECETLSPPEHGYLLDECEMIHGSACDLECSEGYILEGSSTATCEFDGSDTYWHFEDEPVCRNEVPPTLMSCPQSPFRVDRFNHWGVEVGFVNPRAIDNFDTELLITTDPLDLKSPYNFTSDTTCTYTFTDEAGNSVSCLFIVDITSIDLVVSCDVPDSPVTLPVGHHEITCYVSDPETGLRSECKMDFEVTYVNRCPQLYPPENGALACDMFVYGQFCSMLCDKDYDIPRTGPRTEMFICSTSGDWNRRSDVPGCSERKPTRMSRNVLPETLYYPSPCSEDEETSDNMMAEKKIRGNSPVNAMHTNNQETTIFSAETGCNEGHYFDKVQLKCVPCPIGYYLDVATEICNQCDLGFYQDKQAQNECKPCREDTSTIEKGATDAKQCKETLCGDLGKLT